MSYNFSEYWFLTSYNGIPHPDPWKKILPSVLNCNESPIKALEIGSFEGLSAVWMLNNILTHPDSHLTCVDPFTGNVEHSADQVSSLYERFMRNVIDNFPNKVSCFKDYSYNVLRLPVITEKSYDLIYIDGDHHASAAMEDAVLAFRILRVGGVMIFDDYLWDHVPFDSVEHPRRGIDTFLHAYFGKYAVLYSGYQIFIQKIAD